MNDQTNNDTLQIQNASQPFLNTGLGHIAYVRPIQPENGLGYGIFAANGLQLAAVETPAVAYGIIKQNNLEPVQVH